MRISHIGLPAILRNLLIVNGGNTFYVRLHGGCSYIFDVHSSFLIIACFIPSQALMFEF